MAQTATPLAWPASFVQTLLGLHPHPSHYVEIDLYHRLICHQFQNSQTVTHRIKDTANNQLTATTFHIPDTPVTGQCLAHRLHEFQWAREVI